MIKSLRGKSMYIPNHYKENDIQEIKRFMMQHQFVTVVSTDNGKPLATHVPINITEDEESIYISGHFAKSNTQWKTIEQADQILVIFQGPHSYISATWYEEEDVPTWNYQSVHVYGRGKILTEQALKHDLSLLLDKYEKHRSNGMTWGNMSEKTRKQIQGIVGFQIKVLEINAAYKLSQKRSDQDKSNIIEALESSEDDLNNKVAKAMKRCVLD